MKLRYIIFVVLIAAVVISMIAIGFANRNPSVQKGTLDVKFAELVEDPAAYNEKHVVLDAFIFLGFEANVICESLEPSGLSPEHFIPRGAVIWIEGVIPPQVYDSLYLQQVKGPVERYGKVRTNGVFQAGGGYGHLGGYGMQIVLSKIAILIWSP